MAVPLIRHNENRDDDSVPVLPPVPPQRLTYAIWVRGSGWLRHDAPNAEIFATEQREVADAVLALYQGDAAVCPFDESMPFLEKTFLQRERERTEQALLLRLQRRLSRHGSNPKSR